MIIERDAPILMDDGLVLKADVFRPDDEHPAPCIMTQGPYGKGVPYRDGYKPQWDWLMSTYPDLQPTSSKEYMVWETVDPEVWVPFGYICIRVDSRGAGRSAGYLDIFSPREIQDYYEAIEWAGVQPWSNGKVGLNGISYFAITQWLVASLEPPHLAAIIPWEGAADFYRDFSRHGGIHSNRFVEAWYPKQVETIQHGNQDSVMDPWIGQRASGPEALTDTELKHRRSDPIKDVRDRPLDSEWYRARSADWSRVKVPFLSAASWGGLGLHSRGNFEAFTEGVSSQKWLEVHTGRHEEQFYLDQGVALQRRFLDHFLKGVDNGWDEEPPVMLQIRRPFTNETTLRKEQSWPLPATKWTKLYFSTADSKLLWDKPGNTASLQIEAKGKPITLLSPPLDQELEITGPLAAKVFASSSTQDFDLFMTLQAFCRNGNEVDFQGAVDPRTPLSKGWLRASHRKLDGDKTLPYRPYHTHDELQPLEPNRVYELDVELWPTSIVLPAGFQLALQISGHDFERSDPLLKKNEAWTSDGSGPFLHDSAEDRPDDIFAGTTTIFSGGERQSSYVLLPVISS